MPLRCVFFLCRTGFAVAFLWSAQVTPSLAFSAGRRIHRADDYSQACDCLRQGRLIGKLSHFLSAANACFSVFLLQSKDTISLHAFDSRLRRLTVPYRYLSTNLRLIANALDFAALAVNHPPAAGQHLTLTSQKNLSTLRSNGLTRICCNSIIPGKNHARTLLCHGL